MATGVKQDHFGNIGQHSKIPITNLRELKFQFYEAMKSGARRKDLVVWRHHNAKASLWTVQNFCRKLGKLYPELCKELKHRSGMLDDKEIMYVWAQADGSYDLGVLAQRINNMKQFGRPS
jgi:hypothetical protein